MAEVQKFTFNPYQENTYIVYDDTKEAVIFDPGCMETFEEMEIRSFLEANELELKRLINTHCHIDHVWGNAFIKREYGLQLEIPKGELEVLLQVPIWAETMGMHGFDPAHAEILLDATSPIEFGNTVLKTFSAPGHSPDHLVFLNEKDNFLIGGDVLFQGSFGRYDLPGGDLATLKKSITEILFKMNDNVTVYCGHGPETTIGHEKLTNPILTF